MRRMGDKMPGSNRTYGEHFEDYRLNLIADLTEGLTEDQMRKLMELKVAWWEVNTGYDPWGAYMREKLSGR